MTLIELVIVIVLLGITALALIPVISGNLRIYADVSARTEVTAGGRLALERLARELRHAVPNTVRVDADDGHWVEFVRSRAGGRYVIDGDPANGSWCTGADGTAFRRTELCFAAGEPREGLYLLGLGAQEAFVLRPDDHLVIGSGAPGGLAGASVRLTGSGPTSDCTEASEPGEPPPLCDGIGSAFVLSFPEHTFAQASPGQHAFIADRSLRIALQGSTLYWYEGAGLAAYLHDGPWEAPAVLAEGVEALKFSYRPGTPQASPVLRIALTLTSRGERIRLYQEVQVRNAM